MIRRTSFAASYPLHMNAGVFYVPERAPLKSWQICITTPTPQARDAWREVHGGLPAT